MPAYNSERFIAEAIESVLAQTYQDLELLVIDDASTDNTLKIVEEYSDDPRLRIVVQPCNSGPAAARNRATEMASGRYIAFLDADDTWTPVKLSRQIAAMSRNGWPFT